MNDLQLLLEAGLAAIAAGASLFGLFSIIRQRRKRRGSAPAADAVATHPYRRVEALLTPSERALYRILRPIAETAGAEVFAKVRLEDVVQVRKGAPEYQAHRSQVGACGIDFLLCDRQKLVPLLVLQMDGIARERAGREERERFLMQALGAVGVPIFKIPARASYDVEEIGALVHEQIGGPWDRPGAVPVHIAPEGGQSMTSQEEPEPQYVQADDTAETDGVPNWLDPLPVQPAWPAASDTAAVPAEDPLAEVAPDEAGQDLEVMAFPEPSLALAADNTPEQDAPSGDPADVDPPQAELLEITWPETGDAPALELLEATGAQTGDAPALAEHEAALVDARAAIVEAELPLDDATVSNQDDVPVDAPVAVAEAEPPVDDTTSSDQDDMSLAAPAVAADPALATQPADDAVPPTEDSAPAEGAAPCPLCGQALVPMQDIDTGEIVLACSQYPVCGYIRQASQ